METFINRVNMEELVTIEKVGIQTIERRTLPDSIAVLELPRGEINETLT
jgi:hypothetical protein